jgi:hypothetical protein
VRDVVYVDLNGNPKIFDPTQELVSFLRDKTRFSLFNEFTESRMFHALVFVLLLVGVFWARWPTLATRTASRSGSVLRTVGATGPAAGSYASPVGDRWGCSSLFLSHPTPPA